MTSRAHPARPGNASRTNILLRLEDPNEELSQISVFANASAAHRYEMFLLASAVPAGFEAIGPPHCSHGAAEPPRPRRRCLYSIRDSSPYKMCGAGPE
jgi:hypothetical protein